MSYVPSDSLTSENAVMLSNVGTGCIMFNLFPFVIEGISRKTMSRTRAL